MAKPKITCAEDVDRIAEEYFEECKRENKYPVVSMLAYRLGIDRHTLLKYERSIDEGTLVTLDDSVKASIVTSIKKHKAYIEGQYEDRLLNDARSPIGTLFTLKNNYGWVDKQEIVNTESKIEVKLED